jgi:hypothetical protein
MKKENLNTGRDVKEKGDEKEKNRKEKGQIKIERKKVR